VTAAPEPDRYRRTLYHFDEAIKVFIRSFVVFEDEPGIESEIEHLVQYFPESGNSIADCGIRFAWGIWFQIAYVIVRLGMLERYERDLKALFCELGKQGYLENFIAEIDCPDYELRCPV
jgi:hypothetical protein